MAWDADFEGLMESTIIVFPTISSRSRYGVETYSTAGSTYKAHLREVHDVIRGANGEEIAIRTVAWVASTSSLSTAAAFQVPDGTRPPLAAMERLYDEDGLHHHKLMFGY